MSHLSVDERFDPAARLQACLLAPSMRQLVRRLLLGYVMVTLVGLAALCGLYVTSGRAGVAALGAGQGSSPDFLAFALTWVMIGALLFVSQHPPLIRDHLAFVGAFAMIAFGYLNVWREPHDVRYGDFPAYFLAAASIQAGVPWSAPHGEAGPVFLYLYPPLLATLLAPLTPLGLDRLLQVFDAINYLAVLALAVLLYLSLRRYGFSNRTAALASFLMLIVNVAVLRTLIYRQINLHVLDLVLLSLVAYGVSVPVSAAALALAVQLKVSPLFLVLAFVYARDWRWICWFAATQVAIVVSTSIATSPVYYLQFFDQVVELRETAPRNVAVDVLVYNLAKLLALGDALRGWETFIALGLRATLVGVALITAWRLANTAWFPAASDRQRVVLIGFMALPVGMLLAAPTIWEHHFVFLILTMVVSLPWLRQPWEFVAWLLAYVFIFLQPVYDVFPVSYTRLAGLLLVLSVLYSVARTRVADRQAESN